MEAIRRRQAARRKRLQDARPKALDVILEYLNHRVPPSIHGSRCDPYSGQFTDKDAVTKACAAHAAHMAQEMYIIQAQGKIRDPNQRIYSTEILLYLSYLIGFYQFKFCKPLLNLEVASIFSMRGPLPDMYTNFSDIMEVLRSIRDQPASDQQNVARLRELIERKDVSVLREDVTEEHHENLILDVYRSHQIGGLDGVHEYIGNVSEADHTGHPVTGPIMNTLRWASSHKWDAAKAGAGHAWEGVKYVGNAALGALPTIGVGSTISALGALTWTGAGATFLASSAATLGAFIAPALVAGLWSMADRKLFIEQLKSGEGCEGTMPWRWSILDSGAAHGTRQFVNVFRNVASMRAGGYAQSRIHETLAGEEGWMKGAFEEEKAAQKNRMDYEKFLEQQQKEKAERERPKAERTQEQLKQVFDEKTTQPLTTEEQQTKFAFDELKKSLTEAQKQELDKRLSTSQDSDQKRLFKSYYRMATKDIHPDKSDHQALTAQQRESKDTRYKQLTTLKEMFDDPDPQGETPVFHLTTPRSFWETVTSFWGSDSNEGKIPAEGQGPQ